MTSNRLVAFAKERELPFLCVHAGPENSVTQDGSVTFLTLTRSPLSFSMDEGLKYDPFFHRHYSRVRRELLKFRPDVVHITGVNDVSIIGAHLSRRIDVALIGSWHTNVHEYAARRLNKKLRFLSEKTRTGVTNFIEKRILSLAKLYYRIPYMVLAPNNELLEMLAEGTGRAARLMARGVDPNVFSPERRTASDDVFRFGYVGRLRAEKNVRLLAELEQKLIDAGKTNFEFLIVGEGSERKHLEEKMKYAVFPGFLEDEPLAEAYANMDVFVFPSETETYGNVIREANASGVPCIVTDRGGPKYIVENGRTGFIAGGLNEFAAFAMELMDDREKLSNMKSAARELAMTGSWDSVFEAVYKAYAEVWDYLENEKELRKLRKRSSFFRSHNPS